MIVKTKEDELKQHSDLPRRIIGMKNKFVSVYIIIGIWVVVFLLARIMPLNTYFSNKGMDYMDGEYYRYLTAEFCHINLFHLLVNCLGLYYITIYLNDIVNEITLAFSFKFHLLSLLFTFPESVGHLPK